MAAVLSTSALRRRLRAVVGGGSGGGGGGSGGASGRRSWSREAPRERGAGANKAKKKDSPLLVWDQLHVGVSISRLVIVWECLRSWGYVHNETINIYSHIVGAILFILFPLYIFSDGVPPRLNAASTADVVVCSVYALGVTICFVLSTAEAVYLAGIRADFHGVLALMWSSTAPLAHYTFAASCSSPRARDAYVLATAALAALCAAATGSSAGSESGLGAVHLGHHRAALFATFGLTAFVVPLGHGAWLFGAREEWARVGGGWVAVTAGCNAVAVLVYWAKVPERWFPKTFDLFGASHQIMHIMVLAAALAYAKAVVAAFDYRHSQGPLMC